MSPIHVARLTALLCGVCAWPSGLAASTPARPATLARAQPSAALPFRGTLTLEDYETGASGGSLAIIDLSLPGGQKTRLRSGSYPWRHPKGLISFVQGCGGGGVNQVALDNNGLTTLVSPCSDAVKPTDLSPYFPGNFQFSRLSPDGRRVAAEFYYPTESGGQAVDVLVYDLKGNMINFFKNRVSPAWLPDGRLAMGGDGIIVTDQALTHPARLDKGQLSGSLVNNLDVNPAGTQIAFAYNQQIWTLDVKTGTPRRTVTSDVILRYPVYSPDGSALAYLLNTERDEFVQQVHFLDLKTGKSYSLPFPLNRPGIDTPNGPLSWNK